MESNKTDFLLYRLYMVIFHFFVNNVWATETAVSIQDVQTWDNGAKFNLTNDGENQVLLTAEAQEGLPEDQGVVSLFLYQPEERNIKSFDAVSFYVENHLDQELPINLTINIDESEENSFQIPANKPAWLKAKNSDELQSLVSSDEGFMIPGDFVGEVYIPLESFQADAETNPFQTIVTIGLNFSLTEKVHNVNAKLGNVNFLSKSKTDQQVIVGVNTTKEITVPMQGTKIIEFGNLNSNNVSNTDSLKSFEVIENVTGVNISENGTLNITPQAPVNQDLTVKIVDQDTGTFAEETVYLDKVSDNDMSKVLPISRDVLSYSTKISRWLNEYIWIIRITVFICVVVALEAFGQWLTLDHKYLRDSQNLMQETLAWKRRMR